MTSVASAADGLSIILQQQEDALGRSVDRRVFLWLVGAFIAGELFSIQLIEELPYVRVFEVDDVEARAAGHVRDNASSSWSTASLAHGLRRRRRAKAARSSVSSATQLCGRREQLPSGMGVVGGVPNHVQDSTKLCADIP